MASGQSTGLSRFKTLPTPQTPATVTPMIAVTASAVSANQMTRIWVSPGGVVLGLIDCLNFNQLTELSNALPLKNLRWRLSFRKKCLTVQTAGDTQLINKKEIYATQSISSLARWIERRQRCHYHGQRHTQGHAIFIQHPFRKRRGHQSGRTYRRGALGVFRHGLFGGTGQSRTDPRKH